MPNSKLSKGTKVLYHTADGDHEGEVVECEWPKGHALAGKPMTAPVYEDDDGKHGGEAMALIRYTPKGSSSSVRVQCAEGTAYGMFSVT